MDHRTAPTSRRVANASCSTSMAVAAARARRGWTWKCSSANRRTAVCGSLGSAAVAHSGQYKRSAVGSGPGSGAASTSRRLQSNAAAVGRHGPRVAPVRTALTRGAAGSRRHRHLHHRPHVAIPVPRRALGAHSTCAQNVMHAALSTPTPRDNPAKAIATEPRSALIAATRPGTATRTSR